MKLTKKDQVYLKELGHEERDFAQIEEAMKAENTQYELHDANSNPLTNGRPISRDDAIRLLGRETYLSGIARSAFHHSAMRKSDDGTFVYFDSEAMFRH